MPGPTEIMIICGVIVLLFGASQIPKFARSVGKAKREFEKGLKDGGDGEAPEEKPAEEKPVKQPE